MIEPEIAAAAPFVKLLGTEGRAWFSLNHWLRKAMCRENRKCDEVGPEKPILVSRTLKALSLFWLAIKGHSQWRKL